MLFDTPIYFVFLSLVVLLYWRLSRKRQNVLLLGASYLFYGWWDWRFLSLILISTVVDFYCARAIAASDDPRKRKILLILSLAVNISFLGFFKYFNFFVDSADHVGQALGLPPMAISALRILLPPGISFYTFQEIAYIVDVYFKKLKPAESLVDYALFITLFPHLIAGPIQRPSHLLPQVQVNRVFHSQSFFNGLLLILSGLFRKCVVADNCALLAEAAFSGKLGDPSLPVMAVGAYAFAWQIYGDFSGYSDIARGSAQLLGFHFMVNFRQPYLARTLQDFWRRWHISLSTWLRDYLYIPLGGNRHGEARTYGNLMTTMLLGGLWHGANWTFVVWGGIHGAWLSAERLFTRSKEKEEAPMTVLASLLSPVAWMQRIALFHIVCFTWIFFRAQSVGDALAFIRGAASLAWRPELQTAFIFLAAFAIPLFLLDLALELRDEEFLFENAPQHYAIAAGLSMLGMVTLFAANQVNAFIYFQF